MKKKILSRFFVSIFCTSLFAGDLVKDFKDDLVSDLENSALDSWALVTEQCTPLPDIQRRFSDMSQRFDRVMGMMMTQFNGGSITDAAGKAVTSVLDQDLISDALAMILTTQKCVENLASTIGDLAPVTQRIRAETTECMAKYTRGAVTSDTGTSMGTVNAATTNASVDVGQSANMRTCNLTARSEVLGELFDDCYISEKQVSRDFLEDLVSNVASNYLKDIELQHEKCKIDKQNYEETYQGVTGSDYKTVSNGDEGVTIISTNSVYNTPSVLAGSINLARTSCSNFVTKIRNSSNQNDLADFKIANSYRDVLESWCKDVFPTDGCSFVEVNAESVEAQVYTCRWGGKVIGMTRDEMRHSITINTPNAFHRITIIDECLEVVRSKEPLRYKSPLIIIKENFHPISSFGEKIVNDFPNDELTRFNYYLQRHTEVQSKYNGFRIENLFNVDYEKYTNFAMQQICTIWFQEYELSRKDLKAKHTRYINKKNLSENGKLTEADKVAKEILDESMVAQEQFINSVSERFKGSVNPNLIPPSSKDIATLEYKIFN